MGILFSPEVIFIISIILVLISIHGLLLCVIDYNQLKSIVTIFFLLFGLFIIYRRTCFSIKIFHTGTLG